MELDADCDDLLSTVREYERMNRVEKANRMKYAFLLGQNADFMDKAGYEEGVAGRQSKERKEKAAKNTDVEMRFTELCVRGTKRKAMRKDTHHSLTQSHAFIPKI